MKIWHAKKWVWPDNQWRGAMGGMVWPGNFVEETLGPIEFGTLFAYMFRRFGVPEIGSDPHKELANWYITTTDKHVALCVSPRPSGMRHSFGYMIDSMVKCKRHDPNQIFEVEEAIKNAMCDLLSPVFVRDCPINAVGRVDWDSDIANYEVPECEWAGYGVPHTYFKDKFGSPHK